MSEIELMSIKNLFGTDGIRGHINSSFLQPENIAKLGRVLGNIVTKNRLEQSRSRPSIVIGRDTRASGTYLEYALISGITSLGVDCHLMGILPTSAIAFYTKLKNADLGIAISASHNPYHDNGLKIFDAHGFKISRILEETIEKSYEEPQDYPSLMPGAVINPPSSADDYAYMIKSTFKLGRGEHRKIIVDCAHGAASYIAPRIFEDLGFSFRYLGINPDGININRGFGSEWPDQLRNEVIKEKADLGLAFDGDADRVIFVDERGLIIDGDAILALLAQELNRSGRLRQNTLVTTVMSNVALDRLLAKDGIKVVRTEVGDKNVARCMLEGEYSFGGENSGHLIMFPETTTGDGIFSALQLMAILSLTTQPVSELVEFYKSSPKSLINIDVVDKIPLEALKETQALILKANSELKNGGRVMLRYSGTENKARLLVEAPTVDECQKISHTISEQFGLEVKALVN
jgi:phosphoglucosamine mutase